MKVRELKELLAEADDDDEVVLSKDSEGNNYSPLSSGWLGIYAPTTTWYGDVYMRELTDDDRAHGYGEGDLYHGEHGQNALVLCPVC